MFDHLHISDPRERRLVGLADAVLGAVLAVRRIARPRRPAAEPRRILLLRLERIGDLVMTLDAIEAVRRAAPGAAIDLVVGSWNAPLARLVDVATVETLDAPWLAREDGGTGYWQALRRARSWRTRHYDLGINFEPDIRSNLLLALSGARRRIGYSTGGGGALLTDAIEHRPQEHTSVNAVILARRAFPHATAAAPAARARLRVPDEARRQAARLLEAGRPAIGIHASGGRDIKQWAPDRFAAVATRLARDRHARIVLTGAPADKGLVERVASLMDPSVRPLVLAGDPDLVSLAALLERLDLVITGDTGPMHLAAAVGTPIVAVFGPSDPVRYAPYVTAPAGAAAGVPASLAGPGFAPAAERGSADWWRLVRVDLPCSPCNRIRRPPARCVGHVPDCLQGVTVEAVVAAAEALLDRRGASGIALAQPGETRA